jgi:hypothetical protein
MPSWIFPADCCDAVVHYGEQTLIVLILRMTSKQTRKSYGAGWADVAKGMVAMFRATHDVWTGDPAFADLLARLRQGQSGIRQTVGSARGRAAFRAHELPGQ